MSEHNSMLFTPPQPTLLDLAKDSAAVAAQMASIAMQAEDRNMYEMRTAFADLAHVFSAHARKLTDACIESQGKDSH